MAIPSPATRPQRFGKHKPTPGSDLWGEAADIRIEPPSLSMPLPGAAASVIKSVAWPERVETGAAGGSRANWRCGNLLFPQLFLSSGAWGKEQKLR